MKSIITTISQVLTGAKKLDEEWKYSRICYCIALVHLIFTCVFYRCDIFVLTAYNAVITIAYAWLGYSAVRKGQYSLIYYSSYVEIIFHSVFATLLVGWNWGFMIYTISLVAVSFYYTMALIGLKHKIAHPFCASIIVTVAFLATRIITQHIPPVYENIASTDFITYFYCFNSFIAFLMCFVFCMLFTIEVWYMQNYLMTENNILDEMASRDPLTKLLNRRSMEPHLNHVMEQARVSGTQFCVIMGDIDDFKKVNDTYGHDYGDKVLVAVSQTIRREMRSEDQLCRWGGEEFLLLIHTNGERSIKTAERIRKAISDIHIRNAAAGIDISITMTFGVSSYMPGYNMEKLIRIADQNLYKGKKNGKNQVVS